MRNKTKGLVFTGTVLAAVGAAGTWAQQASAPIARYEMRAETMSGLGGMGGGGGGVGAAMSMAFGGAPKAQHMLWLDLGSSRAAADGKPRAEHFMPAGAKLGKSVDRKSVV